MLTPVTVIFVIAAVAIAARSAHTIVLEARTTSLSISFSAGENHWRVEGPVDLCLFDAAMSEPQRLDAPCGPPLFQHAKLAGFEIQWPENATIRMSADHSGELRMMLDSAPTRFEGLDGKRYLLKPGSFLRMDPDTARDAGLFAFLGTASLGRPAGPNETNFIYDGNYEIRLPVNRWFLFGPERDVTIKTGALVRGHTAAIMKPGSDGFDLAEGFGHVALDRRETGDFALSAVFVSVKDSTHLEIRQWGRRGPVVIRPSWIDVTLNSPFILGFLAIAALALSGAQVFYDALEALTDPGDKDSP
ncbi:hypothetical protein N5A93_18480 [Roseovarius sp. EGI FJ00037]|uniref:hypothetical protein n=1 Tax=Roseovarius salincola TaxID=2978479 RepID=UPI0022A82AF9|nr:hypothetical protein [Roseovarius sp. EGI FJ00037]MCZ0814210.1 hypothetical protein [Roseovarius sp. EGI FJ00037]